MKASRKFSRSLVGDFLFDVETEKHRNRLFLPRNMKQVLHHHQSRRARASAGGASDQPLTNGHSAPPKNGFNKTGPFTVNGTPGSTPAKPNGAVPEQFTKGVMNNGDVHESDTSRPWKEQISSSCIAANSRRSRRHQVEAFQERGAEMTLDLRNIRKKLNFSSNLPVDISDGERPRKRVRRDIIECQCHITIWDNREGVSNTEPLAKRSQPCYLSTRDGIAGSKFVDIELSKPMSIRAAELEVPVSQNNRRSTGIVDKYFLEVKIIPCEDSGIEWPPLPILSKSEGELFAGGVDKSQTEALQGALVARYMHLPHAPASEVPLSVFFLHGGRAYKTKYGLEMNGEWAKPVPTIMRVKEEPLDDYGKLAPWALDEAGAPFGRTPSEPKSLRRSSRRSSQPKAESNVEVSYIFDPRSKETSKPSRTATLKGFCCPACRIGEFDDLKELQFHLINSHHKYRFDLESEDTDKETGELKSVTFAVNPVDVKKPKNLGNIISAWEWNWNAPEKPFDLDAYVKGDHEWIGAPPVRKVKAPPAQVLSSDPLMALRQRNGGFLPVDEVPELPDAEKKRKRYAVVETRTRGKLPLYTSVSHRLLRMSEEPMSDSDDEMDGEWVRAKHMREIDEVEGLDRGQREFRKMWDRHRMDESGGGGEGGHPRFLSDSLVRFVKKNRVWLRDGCDGCGGEGIAEFWSFVGVLKERRAVDEKVVAGLWGLIYEEEEKKDSEPNGVNGRRDRNGDVEMADGAATEARPEFVDPSYEDTHVRCKRSLVKPQCPCDICGEEASKFSTVAAEERVAAHKPSAPGLREEQVHQIEALLSLPPGTCGICRVEFEKFITQAIRCADDECEAPGVLYHLACVKQKDRYSGWVCDICRGRNAANGKARAV